MPQRADPAAERASVRGAAVICSPLEEVLHLGDQFLLRGGQSPVGISLVNTAQPDSVFVWSKVQWQR